MCFDLTLGSCDWQIIGQMDWQNSVKKSISLVSPISKLIAIETQLYIVYNKHTLILESYINSHMQTKKMQQSAGLIIKGWGQVMGCPRYKIKPWHLQTHKAHMLMYKGKRGDGSSHPKEKEGKNQEHEHLNHGAMSCETNVEFMYQTQYFCFEINFIKFIIFEVLAYPVMSFSCRRVHVLVTLEKKERKKSNYK